MIKIASYAGTAIGTIVAVSVISVLLFPDPFVDRFVKPAIIKGITEAYPAYSLHIGKMNYSILENRFGFNDASVKAVDGTFSGSIGPLSVSGIEWMHLLWGGTLAPENFVDMGIDVHDVVINFPHSQYEVYCKRLQISVPDSDIVAESVEFFPMVGDEEFFRNSSFRRTRFCTAISKFTVNGLGCLELLEGKQYRARSIRAHELILDILINKEKPAVKDSLRSPMPNEILASIKGTLQIDRLKIDNGRLNYGERFAVGGKPAVITFDDMFVTAQGIANHGGKKAAVDIRAQGNFMKAGMMKVHMSIPISSKEFSYTYSGSLTRTNLRSLNAFLETAEQLRIKDGVLETATFEINVVSGRASGYLRAIYKDLRFALINKKTGSDKGFFNMISSFIANTFKIHGTNLPDKTGVVKMGTVTYTKKSEEYFMEFTWFALRSGVRDIVGF